VDKILDLVILGIDSRAVSLMITMLHLVGQHEQLELKTLMKCYALLDVIIQGPVGWVSHLYFRFHCGMLFR
jgi:hypothetical protein